MPRFRFSLGTLLLVVILVACTFAGLRAESELWPALFVTGSSLALLVAVLAAVYRRNDSRAFWVGFAVVGWGHWLLAYAPGVSDRVEVRAMTQRWANSVHPKLQRQLQQPGAPTSGSTASGTASASGTAPMSGAMTRSGMAGMGGMASGGGSMMGAQSGGMPGAIRSTGYGTMGSMMGGMGAGMPAGPGAGPVITLVGPSSPQVWRILHSLLTLLLAVCGGLIARHFYCRTGSSLVRQDLPTSTGHAMSHGG